MKAILESIRQQDHDKGRHRMGLHLTNVRGQIESATTRTLLI